MIFPFSVPETGTTDALKGAYGTAENVPAGVPLPVNDPRMEVAEFTLPCAVSVATALPLEKRVGFTAWAVRLPEKELPPVTVGSCTILAGP